MTFDLALKDDGSVHVAPLNHMKPPFSNGFPCFPMVSFSFKTPKTGVWAQENWGIITLTDRALMDETASLRKRQGVAPQLSIS